MSEEFGSFEYSRERAALRRSLVESIGDEFAKCLTDGRLAEVVADWPGVAPIEVAS